MEKIEWSQTVEQMHVRGLHEKITTNTSQLSHELSRPQDIGRLVADFDEGFTPLRDVGGMCESQRSAILDSYENESITDLATNYPELISVPVDNLGRRIISGSQDQPVGHNFFVNATGFIDAGFPWALQFDNLFRTKTGYPVHDLVRHGGYLAEKDHILYSLTKQSDDLTRAVLATYLAGRSLEGERYLDAHYGLLLRETAAEAYTTTQRIGESTGLKIELLERAAQQLYRTKFGSFDHLAGLVTTENTGAAGDYRISSLRIEVQFDGSVRTPVFRSEDNAKGIIAHELQHAASAQSESRCGLQSNGQGLEVNEGMTEYLAQISLDKSGILQLDNGGKSVSSNVAYKVPVLAMLVLHEEFKSGKNQHFATLFNVYHGDVRKKAELEEALDHFYKQDEEISRSIR